LSAAKCEKAVPGFRHSASKDAPERLWLNPGNRLVTHCPQRENIEAYRIRMTIDPQPQNPRSPRLRFGAKT
jgi:hypothetical protein